jgi:hypothetical protein
LWVINWVHTQLKLGLVWVPTGAAHKQVVILGLYDLTSQFGQFETKPATVAFRNRILA